MNKEAAVELCKRALACKHWRWIIGCVNEVGECYAGDHLFYLGTYPDIFQPATLGCLVVLVQEAYGDKVVISQGNGWWSVETDHYRWDDDNTTSFQEALVKTLEAAK